jgi:Flp pilus assembly protein TadG
MELKARNSIMIFIQKRKSEYGQSMVELAASMVFLVMLLSLVIDVGWAYYTMTTLRDTVQEAAAYGAICPLASDNTTANTVLIRERFRLSVTAPIDMNDIDPNDVVITFTNAAGNTVTKPVMGGGVRVEATIHHQIMTPFLGAIIGTQTYPLTVNVTNTVMRKAWMKQCDF